MVLAESGISEYEKGVVLVYFHLIAIRVHREVFSPHSRQIPELDIGIVWVIIWCWFFAALSDTNLGCLFVEVFKAEKKKNNNNNNKKRRRVKKLVPGTTYATCLTALLLLL